MMFTTYSDDETTKKVDKGVRPISKKNMTPFINRPLFQLSSAIESRARPGIQLVTSYFSYYTANKPEVFPMPYRNEIVKILVFVPNSEIPELVRH